MMRFRLRTLMIVLAIGPPALAGVWIAWRYWRAERELAPQTSLRVTWDDGFPYAVKAMMEDNKKKSDEWWEEWNDKKAARGQPRQQRAPGPSD